MSKNKSSEKDLQQEEVVTEEKAATEEQTEPVQEESAANEALEKYLRLAAEFDNYKKRTIKEREQIAENSKADIIKAFLPVMDNVTRAVAAVADADDSVKQGVELIAKQVGDIFAKLGIEKIPALGETFDPNLHDAVMHIEDDSCADSVIVEEFEAGYKYNDKVIRHSIVKVAN